MSLEKSLLSILTAALLLVSCGLGRAADTTYVRFNTVMGPIDVQLLSDEAPNTVANFLNYVDHGAYYESLIHRSTLVATSGFSIIQGGSYNVRNLSLSTIPTNAPIANEFGISNTRGTLAMTLLGSDLNSATSGWFFNTVDNSAQFDSGGYTVFGQVANAASLAVMDALQAIPVPAGVFAAPFDQMPLISYAGAGSVQLDNLVFVTSVTREADLPAPATITLGNLNVTNTNVEQGVSFTTNPPGLDAVVTYNGNPNAPGSPGTYAVVATINSPGYTGSTTGTFVIASTAVKSGAKLVFGNLKAVYDGNPHAVTATTTPPGLAVTFTYDGQTAIPTSGGSHAVVATVNDPVLSGVFRATQVITPAKGTVVVTNTSLTYNGSSQAPTVTTNPPGLPVAFTYSGKSSGTNVGTYKVVAAIDDPSYTGTASGILTITKASATVSVGTITAFYNGQAQTATATTTPANLSVAFTYNGSAKPPILPNTYIVVATITDPNFSGSASGTLTIGTAPAAALLGATSVELTEGVLPGGVATSARFDYGTTTNYDGFTAWQVLGKGVLPVNIFALLSNLQPGTLYHYRLETMTSSVPVAGPDHTFTTLGFDTGSVAEKSVVAPGTNNGIFASFGNPIINANDSVAFAGALTLGGSITKANDTGIWAEDNTQTLQKITQLGDAAPGAGGATFLTLGDPVFNDTEQVAFCATVNSTKTQATGIWSNSGGSLALVARQGGAAPGASGGTFSTFTSLALANSGGVLFLATLNASKAPLINATNNMGIWQGNSTGDLHLVLRVGQIVNSKTITKLTFLPAITIVNGQTRGFSSAVGNFVCNATFSDKSTGIISVIGGTAQVVVQSKGQVVSGNGATYATFNPPAINNNNHIAFLSTLTISGGINATDNKLLSAQDSLGDQQFIAETGDLAPGTTATFATLGDPVYNDNEAIAFRATLKVAAGQATKTTATGIWCNNANAYSLVAQQGTQAPGCPTDATFATFTELALPNHGGNGNTGGVVFLGTLNANAAAAVTKTNNLGIWAQDTAGNLQLIVRTGDSLDDNGVTKVVTGLTFLPAVTTVNGQGRSVNESTGNLVYVATFSDKSTAIYNVVFQP